MTDTVRAPLRWLHRRVTSIPLLTRRSSSRRLRWVCTVVKTTPWSDGFHNVGNIRVVSRSWHRRNHQGCWSSSRRRVKFVQAVRRIQRRNTVGVGEGGHVEDRVHEIVDRKARRHDGLSNMDQLAGGTAEDVHAEEAPRLRVNEQLEQADPVALDFTPCKLAIAGDAAHIWLRLRCQM